MNYFLVASPHSAVILRLHHPQIVESLRRFVDSLANVETPALFYEQSEVDWQLGGIYTGGFQLGNLDIVPVQRDAGTVPVHGIGYINIVPVELNAVRLSQLIAHVGAINYQLFCRGKQRSLVFTTHGDVVLRYLPRFKVTVTPVSTIQTNVYLRATSCQRLGIEPYLSDLANEEVCRFLGGFPFGNIVGVDLPHHLYRLRRQVMKTIHVVKISHKAQRNEVAAFFSSNFGNVKSVSIGTTDKGSRMAFIKFRDEGVAEQVVKQSHEEQGLVFRNVRLDIHPAFKTEIWSTATGRVQKKKKPIRLNR